MNAARVVFFIFSALLHYVTVGSAKDLILPFAVGNGPATEEDALRYSDFQYIGVTALAGRHTAGSTQPLSWRYAQESSAMGPTSSYAVRVDRGGRVYVSRKKYLIPNLPKPAQDSIVRNNGQHHGRRMSEVFGVDTRVERKQNSTFPFSAVGQLATTENNEEVTCTAAVIGDRQLLTTAHCVFDPFARAWYDDLDFSAGRYVDPKNETINPFGRQTWSHVTTYAMYLDTQQPMWDMAVVTLSEDVDPKAQRFALGAVCSSKVGLTIAGYPADKQSGTMWYTTCNVDAESACSTQLQYHYCDTISGMSGAPMWRNNGTHDIIHAVHAGKADDSANIAVMLTPDHITHVQDWVVGLADDSSAANPARYIITTPTDTNTSVRGVDANGNPTPQVAIINTGVPPTNSSDPQHNGGHKSELANTKSGLWKLVSKSSLIMMVLSAVLLIIVVIYGCYLVRVRRRTASDSKSDAPNGWASFPTAQDNNHNSKQQQALGQKTIEILADANCIKAQDKASNTAPHKTAPKPQFKPVQDCQVSKSHARSGSLSMQNLLTTQSSSLTPRPAAPGAALTPEHHVTPQRPGWGQPLRKVQQAVQGVLAMRKVSDDGFPDQVDPKNPRGYYHCRGLSVEDTPPSTKGGVTPQQYTTPNSRTKLKQELETCCESPVTEEKAAADSGTCARELHFRE